MCPVESEMEFPKYLLSPASSHELWSTENYEHTLAVARSLFDLPYRIVFVPNTISRPIIFFLMARAVFQHFSTASLPGGVRSSWGATKAMRSGPYSWWY